MKRLCFLLFTFCVCSGICKRVYGQAGLDSSGVPQASSTFPVEHGVVNLNNGALHLELPIVNYSQRGGVELPATLNYDSNIWKLNTIASINEKLWEPNGGTPGGQTTNGGWYVSYHPLNQSITPVQWSLLRCANSNNYTYVEPAISWMDQSGTTHVFPTTFIDYTCNGADGNNYVASGIPYTATAYATDGSGYYAQVAHTFITSYPNVDIYDRRGNRVASNDLSVSDAAYTLTTFGGVGLRDGPLLPVDRNGNYPEYQAETVLDTMGRNLVNDTGVVDVDGIGTVEYITVPIAGGNTATYTINYKYINVQTSFSDAGVVEAAGAMLVVSSVDLPDGSSYQFGYNENSFGEVTSMTLPHGGQVTFHYSTAPGLSGAASTRWVDQHVGSDGTTAFLWSQSSTSAYSQGSTNCSSVTNQVSTLSAANTYKFSNCEGSILLREVDHGSATSNTTDAIDLYSYDFSHPCPTIGTATIYHVACLGYQWTNITGKTTVLPANGGAGSDLVTDTQYSYDHPETGVPSSVKQWDYYAGSPKSLPDSPPGLPTHEIDTTLGYAVNGALFPTSTNVKDSAGNVVSSTTYRYDEAAYTSQSSSNAPNHSNTLITGSRGNLTTVSQCCGWNGTSNVPLVSHTWYDDAGTVIATQDAQLNTTTFNSFDPTDTFPTSISLPSTLSPAGATVSHVVGQTYDANSGQVASTTDENNQTTSYSFDSLGRPYQVSFSNAGSPVVLQTITYPSANETDVSVLQQQGVVLSATSTTDAYGRAFQSVQGGISTETYYDAQGRIDHVTNAHTAAPSATDGTTYYKHDELGRISQVTMPNGYSETISYSQNTTTTTDPLNHQREFWSDAFGNTIQVAEPDSSGNLRYLTAYTYNWQNKLQTISQRGGNADPQQWRQRTFNYDGAGRLISQTTPEAGTLNYWYDNNGNLTQTQNNNSAYNTVQYGYDSLDRVVSQVVAGGPSYSYTYDGQDGSGDPFGKGQLTSSSNGSNVQTRWQHDALGRVVQSAYCLPSDCSFATQVSASYDFQGNQTSLTYPDGRQVQWTYDLLNRPVGEAFAQWGSTPVNTPYVSNYSYTPTGQLQQATFGAALQFAGTYDSDGNQSSLAYVANGTPVVQKVYTWDKNATNLTNIQDYASGRQQVYSYDQLDRMQSFSDTGTTPQACVASLPTIPSALQNYAIDPWGNLGWTGTDSFSEVVQNSNQLSSFSYDAAGNVTLDGVNNYTYRADGLMNTSNSTQYTYDAQGERVRKDGSSTTEYIYFGGELLSMRTPGAGSVWTDRIYGPLGALATVPGTQSGSPVYRATDHLGSLSYTLDASGNILSSSNALPYGQLTSPASDTFPFTDHERDADGTDATLYRHYASRHGRWLSPDPYNGSYDLLDPQSLNRYSYLNNRVMAKVDRLGLDGDDDDDDDDDDDNDDDGGWWNDFWSDVGSWFGFGDGGGYSSYGPNGSIPSPGSISGVSGVTAPNGGPGYINATLYYNGSTGVATGAWQSVDFSVGLTLDGLTSIPNALEQSSRPKPKNQTVDPAPAGPPPVPVPGCPSCGWKWSEDSKNPDRGGRWVPDGKLPAGVQPGGASWDTGSRGGPGHWDVDNGTGERKRYYPGGAPMPDDIAHPPGWRPVWMTVADWVGDHKALVTGGVLVIVGGAAVIASGGAATPFVLGAAAAF